MCYLFHNKIINSKYKRRLIFQPSFYKISKLVMEVLTLLLVIFTALAYIDGHNKRK